MSMNILRALGGDTDAQYGSVDEIWNAIDEIYGASGDGIDLVPLNLDIIENGSWSYNITEEVDAYVPVDITVNVPQKYTDEDVNQLQDTARTEGYNSGYETGKTDGYNEGFTAGSDDGYADGYAEGLEDGAVDQKALLEEVTLTENGIYEKEDGYNKVTVDVAVPTFETEGLSVLLVENGDYSYTPTTDGYSSVDVTVNVPEKVFETETLNVTLTENGDYTYASDKDGYSVVSVNVNVAGSGGIGKPKIYNGFTLNPNTYGNYMPYTRLSEFDFSQYDWSGVYDLSYFFAGFYSSTNGQGWGPGYFENFKTNFNGTILAMSHCFDKGGSGYPPLIVPPDLGEMTKDCVDFSYLFNNQSKMTGVSTLANWNTSSVLDMQYMFYNCSSLTSVPLFDTSKVTNMNNMFGACGYLTSVPAYDTSNVTSMASMFNYCSNLTTIPQYDTSKVTNMNSMFANCAKLVSIPLLDLSCVTDFELFGSSTMNALTDLGGFKNLGAERSATSPSNFLRYCSNLTHDSLMNVINNLYDRAAASYPTVTLKLGSTNLAKLTDDEKAIVTNKGFILG